MASGGVHGDIALAEAVSSLREFHHLVALGVPFPRDTDGAFTGGDPLGRGVSAGPETRQTACECLRRRCHRLKIEIHDQHQVAHLLTRDEGENRRIAGILTFDKTRAGDETFGIAVFLCENLVLAAGGLPGISESDSDPDGQACIHGLALAAGLKAQGIGGFVVDKWWQSSMPHTFVIGEMAGMRASSPDGVSVNAGQVGGLRAAQHIADIYGARIASSETHGARERTDTHALRAMC